LAIPPKTKPYAKIPANNFANFEEWHQLSEIFFLPISDGKVQNIELF
jgi:hypothetical protein